MLSANTFQIHLIAITLSLKNAKRKKPISNYNWLTKPLHNAFICSLDLQASQLPYGIFYSFRHKQWLYTDVANNLLSTCTFFIFSLKHFFYDIVIAIRCTQEYYTPCELDTSPSQAHQASILLLLSIYPSEWEAQCSTNLVDQTQYCDSDQHIPELASISSETTEGDNHKT